MTRNPDTPDGAHTELPDDYAALTATVRELVKVMREGGIGRLEIKRGDLKIELAAREEPAVSGPVPAEALVQATPTQPAADPAPAEEGHIITSPMIGTFYAAPAPGERPFVQVGDTVEVGQTVAIIEAMKIMNEIVADVAGTVVEIMVRDAEPVEYGHPLMRIKPHA
ncbi:MAG: acetyl-CoA carboxylase biotin carboxyl carrier protein [Sphaerobacter sp.]|nr:acetyl-CoA carboxylase biotin carboxyl carrier protein [Sphaerobacter sp.]